MYVMSLIFINLKNVMILSALDRIEAYERGHEKTCFFA